MPAQIAGNLAASGGVTHHHGVFQIERFEEFGEIVSVSVHLVAVPRLAGAAIAAPVVSDDAIAELAQKQHLRVPCVRSQRPAMRERDWLSLTPVLVIDGCSVFGGDGAHIEFSFGLAIGIG
jgi:hypothetical protein